MSITKTFSNLFSDKTLTKKASLNAFASVLDYGTRWLVTFMINPLLVTSLGDFGYGAWQVLSRLIGYISPAGGRPTQALKWTIASQQASTDYEEKRRQVGSAIAVWVMFLPLLFLLGALLAWFVPLWLEAPVELHSGLRWATIVLVGNLIFTNLAEIPQSVLRGENLGYKRMGLTTLFILLSGGLIALALFLHTGIVGVALANLITTVCTGVLFFNIVRSTVAWFGIAKPVFDGIRKFMGLSWWFLAWNLVHQLFKAGDVIILGIFDSAELVSHYSLTRYIPETIIGVVAIIVFGITPGLGGIIGRGDLKKAAQVRGEIMIITWFIVTVFGSTMLLWNRSFVGLWVGGEYYAGNISNLLIILMLSQFVFIRNDANIIDLTLDLRKKVWLGLVSAGLSVGLSVIFVGPLKMGIVGLTIGFICGQSIISVGYPLVAGRFLQVSPASQLKGVIRPIMITGLSFALVSVLGDSLAVSSWPSLILQAGATALLLALLTFYVGMSREQRDNLLSRARKVLLPERNKQ
jgi:O-antigen/teichoic acid export membrane protein